jgi:hypothetical protein
MRKDMSTKRVAVPSVKSDTELAIVASAHAAGDVLLQVAGYWDNTVVTEDVTYA